MVVGPTVNNFLTELTLVNNATLRILRSSALNLAHGNMPNSITRKITTKRRPLLRL
jgi:hypothetical protein